MKTTMQFGLFYKKKLAKVVIERKSKKKRVIMQCIKKVSFFVKNVKNEQAFSFKSCVWELQIWEMDSQNDSKNVVFLLQM